MPAAELLCKATLKAAQEGNAPPVLAVPPTPGSAAVFWQYGRESGSADAPLVPEWTNWHIACSAYGERPKLAFQSFRVNMTLARPLPRAKPVW